MAMLWTIEAKVFQPYPVSPTTSHNHFLQIVVLGICFTTEPHELQVEEQAQEGVKV
jgi:hypothetical protein